MTYKVSFSSDYNFSVKTSQPVNYKTNLVSKIEIMPQNLNELSDVQISGNNDKYVLMYDAASGKWKDVNPDAVLSAAATEPISPGIPTTFSDQLEVDLDNKVDLDAGTF